MVEGGRTARSMVGPRSTRAPNNPTKKGKTMNALILTTDDINAITALNSSGDPERQLRPVPLTDGRSALNADLLSDSAPGQTWEHYRPAIETLPTEEIPLEAIATVEVA